MTKQESAEEIVLDFYYKQMIDPDLKFESYAAETAKKQNTYGCYSRVDEWLLIYETSEYRKEFLKLIDYLIDCCRTSWGKDQEGTKSLKEYIVKIIKEIQEGKNRNSTIYENENIQEMLLMKAFKMS